MTYLRANWKPKWQKQIIRKVKDLWISYRDRTQLPQALSKGSQAQGQHLSKYYQVAQNLTKYRPADQDEFDHFSNGEPSDIGSMTALEWWCQEPQRKRWPRLSCMAIDILSIPAMSAEPERVFSGGRRTISWDRAQLSAAVIEKTECLKHAIRGGIGIDNAKEG